MELFCEHIALDRLFRSLMAAILTVTLIKLGFPVVNAVILGLVLFLGWKFLQMANLWPWWC